MKKIFGAEKAQDAKAARTPETAKNKALGELRSRIDQMQRSAKGEHSRAHQVEREIASLKQQRVTRISLARVEGKEPFTEDLDEKLHVLRSQIEDAAAVEASLAEMAAAEALALNYAVFEARKELSAELDARLADAAERYNALAQETATAARELYALRELMIAVGAGNSNGVDLGVQLPRAVPGDAQPVEPFFTIASREGLAAVKRRSDEIAEELTAVGFVL